MSPPELPGSYVCVVRVLFVCLCVSLSVSKCWRGWRNARTSRLLFVVLLCGTPVLELVEDSPCRVVLSFLDFLSCLCCACALHHQGEVLFWCGIALSGYAGNADFAVWQLALGPIALLVRGEGLLVL